MESGVVNLHAEVDLQEKFEGINHRIAGENHKYDRGIVLKVRNNIQILTFNVRMVPNVLSHVQLLVIQA